MEYLHTLMPKYCCSIVLLLYCIFTSSFTFKTNNYTQSCFYTAFQEQVKQEWGKQRFSFFDTHFSTVASCRQSHDSHMGYHTILSICLAHRLLNEHVGLQKIFFGGTDEPSSITTSSLFLHSTAVFILQHCTNQLWV